MKWESSGWSRFGAIPLSLILDAYVFHYTGNLEVRTRYLSLFDSVFATGDLYASTHDTFSNLGVFVDSQPKEIDMSAYRIVEQGARLYLSKEDEGD